MTRRQKIVAAIFLSPIGTIVLIIHGLLHALGICLW